ncbi:hypothetical protein BDQ17DRAFT_1340470 [Cyathus striatus]|nr:hypothetical protein BDQ17DRAFT_1340470 [Cyathus striatus]
MIMWFRQHHAFVQLTFVFFQLATFCNAFSFQVSKPTQCDNLTVSWEGGQPPFRLIIVPPGGTTRNISIPSDAFQENQGNFSTQLQLAVNQRVFFAMSDATGVTAGGISDVSTVGNPVYGVSCNLTDPGVDFFFSLDDDLAQCKSYPFTQYNRAIQPISILVLIPLGQSFYLYPPIGDSFTWLPNVTAGTPITFSMVDSKGRNGGTSSIRVTKISDDTSCLTSTSSGATPSETSNPSQTTPHSPNLGLIIGVSVGGSACLALATLLVCVCCFRRRRHSHLQNIDLTYDPAGAQAPEPTMYLLPEYYSATPFLLHSPTNHAESLPHQPTSSAADPFLSAENSGSSFQNTHLSPESASYPTQGWQTSPASSDLQHSVMSSTQKRSRSTPLGMSNNSTSPVESTSAARIIVHTDITESMELPIELPPRYSESRAPIPDLLSYGQTLSPSTSTNSRAHLLSGSSEISKPY